MGENYAPSPILCTKLLLEAQGYKNKQFSNIKIIKILYYYRETVKGVRVKGQNI